MIKKLIIICLLIMIKFIDAAKITNATNDPIEIIKIHYPDINSGEISQVLLNIRGHESFLLDDSIEFININSKKEDNFVVIKIDLTKNLIQKQIEFIKVPSPKYGHFYVLNNIDNIIYILTKE